MTQTYIILKVCVMAVFFLQDLIVVLRSKLRFTQSTGMRNLLCFASILILYCGGIKRTFAKEG